MGTTTTGLPLSTGVPLQLATGIPPTFEVSTTALACVAFAVLALAVLALVLGRRVRDARTLGGTLDARLDAAVHDTNSARREAQGARRDAEVSRVAAEAARREAQQSQSAGKLAREIAGASDRDAAAGALARHLGGAFAAEVVVHTLSPDGQTLHRVPADAGPADPAGVHGGLVGYAFHTRRRFSFTGAPPAELPASDEERARYDAAPVRTVSFLPLLHDATVVGIVELRRDLAAPTALPPDDGLRDTMLDIASAAMARLREREALQGELGERRRAAEALEREAAELRDAVRLKDEFLATVAHELRTPLNAIIGWSHVLKSGTADDTTRERALDAVIRNGERQSRLIADLLDLSRVSAGKLDLELQGVVEVAPVVRAALETVRPAAEGKSIVLRSVVDAEAGPLMADPHRLQQVISNLLVNSLKFTPQGGEVSVVVERAAAGVELRISDSGPGVPEELLPHVFDSFRQGVGSARTHGGLGLGLAIVRHLVELHGGTVSVRNNTPDPGATFVVTLPLRPPSHHRATRPVDAAAGGPELPSLEGLRVLLVSDDADARELVASIVRGRGASVAAVTSAAEALAKVRQASPDVLICDLELAGDGGYGLVHELRALPGSEGGATVAVALTSHGRPDDRVRALLCGYQGHLGKPPEPAELVALVASLADRLPAVVAAA